MKDQSFDCDVLVVGLGPVGAAMAALLAAHEVTVIAIDKETTVYPLPRAVHFDHEIMRLFQNMGIAEQVLRHAVALPRYEFRAADGQVLLSFDPVPEAPCGWASGYMFHQPGLEIALRDRLASAPNADVRLGWRFEALTQGAERVTATVVGPDGPAALRARYLVGCEGASSPVREAIGGGLFDYGFDEPWVVIDAKVHPGARMPEANLQICNPARPTTCVHSGPGRHRWEFMLLPGETPETALEDDFIQALLAPWDCGPMELERRAVYRFHGLVAKRWRSGRVLLAGDAAHQTPPFAGQGMCSGLRDAANLAWKLEAVLEGRADESLLDTYQAEREPHSRTLIELAIGMGRIVCTVDRDAAALRDRDMLDRRASGAPSIPPPQPAPFATGCIITGSPGAGDVFPQPLCDLGPDRLRLDDVLGAGAWLISRHPTTLPAVPAHAGLAQRDLGEEVLAPFRGALTRWLDRRGVGAVLVRPDRYVFGAGDPATLAAAWAQALHPVRANAAAEPRQVPAEAS
jgi:3-(3-hydroxy-phenyl)propionate hydroxylase